MSPDTTLRWILRDAVVIPLTSLFKGLSKHEKEGPLPLRGQLSPTTEEASTCFDRGHCLRFHKCKKSAYLLQLTSLLFPDFAKPFRGCL
jgi:hypothetical protein